MQLSFAENAREAQNTARRVRSVTISQPWLEGGLG